ncbi:1,4-alpha-glucan branching protein [Chryseobacterium sp. SNU WT5]|uniref:alpha-amylase family glycosyl hydrolase n=1 Tax=Chryseobacterium sp. SNU WT5 TaxID=2594269 RepID=UPI001180F0C1|nr:alpha-amylase family glycosyl hydrolase [Chryseobacterium sp. SNU WT5]QDP84528.1 1,4-alpha-glucan branching protein [Chryseobacterium sp. SNU WT5]
MDLSNRWKHATNIYEVNIRQYTKEGTFRAFEKEIPRLRSMGIETLWFMPITPISIKNKKGTLGSQYAAQDYVSINSEFGTLEDFKHLVSEAHKMGFKVLIDWVANHTGWDHVWTRTNPEFYLKDPATNDFQIASGMDDIIELDYSNAAMRQAMIDAMKFWVSETDIDGFRCDLASWVQVDFWKQARPEIDEIKPLFLLGEFDELENPEYGKVFDASYTWMWMHKTKVYNQDEISFEDLKDLLIRYSNIGDSSMRAWFTSNHDENTWNGTEYEKYGDLAIPLAVFSITWNGVPLIYNGQELPLKTKRLQFFEKDPIPWSDKKELNEFYQILLNLKTRNLALRGGDPAAKTFIIKTTADDKILAYLRKNDNDEVLTVLNFSKENISFTIDDERVIGIFKNIFSGPVKDFLQDKSFYLPVGGYAVLEK